ncbi:MAG: gliding motility-associated C-terminal domain-containing protein, partial [Bacteroidia bacterium]
VAQALASGGGPPYTFFWPLTAAVGSTAFNLPDGWNYVVITDTANCIVTDSVFIISSPIPIARFSYPSEIICGDQTVVQDTFPQTQGGIYSLISPQSVAGISVDQFSGVIDLSNVSNASLPTWVVVEYAVGIAFCADIFRDSIYVTALPTAPVPDNQSTILSWCNPSAIPVLQITAVPGQNPVWFDSFGNLVALGTNYTPPFTVNTPAGVYTYYVIFTPNISGTMCYSLPTIYTVNVTSGFIITATADTTICPNDPIQLNINGCSTCSFDWLPQTGLDNPFSGSPIATVGQTTSYSITATDQNSGCVAYELISIATDTALCNDPVDSTNVVLEIFNGFTPNADGKNDVWIISGIENATNVRVTIFNRWGGVIWNTNVYDNNDVVFRGFDQNGNIVADGTYYYLITTGTKTQRGWIEITR